MTHVHRRKFLARAVGCAVGTLAAPWLSHGQEASPGTKAAGGLDANVSRAIERGLGFLASRQNEDGAFGREGYRRNAAVVSLAGIAYMAHGSTPGRGPYGQRINQCVNFVLENSQDSGFIFSAGGSGYGPMYGHGFATLFLAEVYGMWPDGQVREKLKKAVRLIINTQNDEGGWRYRPERRDADISVTICQVMALRAARNAGIYVSNETIDRCTDYVKRCQNPDGGFSYQLPNGESRFPRTAAGVVALHSAGIYEGDEVTRGLEYMMQHVPRSDAQLSRTISSMDTTMPCRRCGRRGETTGNAGIRPYVVCCSPSRRKTGHGSIKSVRSTERRWPVWSSRCPITICRSFRDKMHRCVKAKSVGRASEPASETGKELGGLGYPPCMEHDLPCFFHSWPGGQTQRWLGKSAQSWADLLWSPWLELQRIGRSFFAENCHAERCPSTNWLRGEPCVNEIWERTWC